eukprot:3766124-Lingulodinium_polyedra.AAC.1
MADAVICCLLDLGWGPAEPLERADRRGARWRVVPDDDPAEFLRVVLGRDAGCAVWQHAARHQDAAGVEGGGDWTVARRRPRGRQRRGARMEA